MDLVSFFGGLSLGAAGAALVEYANQQKLLGQGVVTGGGPGGGGFGGSYAPGGFGPGVVQGPPGGGGGFGGDAGPAVISMMPDVEGDGEVGPIVSVPPTVHDGDRFIVGDSFFGVSASPWFWPLNVLPIFQLPAVPQTIVCKKLEDGSGEETFVCQRKYPLQPVAWGPPAGWL